MAKAREIKKISDLLPDANNYNKGTEFGSTLIEKSIRNLGAGRSILLDKNGKVIAGNKTLDGLVQAGFDDSDIIVVQTNGKQIVAVQRTDLDLDTKRGKEMALADNATSKANLSWDHEAMSADFESVELEAWGVFAEEIEGGFGDNSLNSEAQEDDYDVPEVETVKTDIVLGDLFEIGPHRLLCGDSTKAEDVDRLMGGVKADMVFTDPPYNVGFNGRSGKFDVIENDKLSIDDFEKFISAVAAVIKKLQVPVKYIWCNWRFYGVLQKHFDVNACIVWAKNVFGLGRGYRHQHEFCFFEGKLDDGINAESDLWEISRDAKYEHPTQKPVALSFRALSNHKNAKNIVDLFGGSGSTLVGVHKSGRNGFINEIDPKYCQVILDRMLKLDPTIEVKKNGQPYKRMAQ